MAEALGKLVTKDDLKRLTVENTPYVLGALSGAGTRADTGEQLYSFRQEEFIHPLIVRELIGWLSDPAETVIAVDLSVANRSNRFAGAVSLTQKDDRTFVKWTSDDRGSFMYAHIATSASGIQMVECYDCGGGSGVFGSVGLFSLEQDRALEKPGHAARTRILLKTSGILSWAIGTMVRSSTTTVFSSSARMKVGSKEARLPLKRFRFSDCWNIPILLNLLLFLRVDARLLCFCDNSLGIFRQQVSLLD